MSAGTAVLTAAFWFAFALCLRGVLGRGLAGALLAILLAGLAVAGLLGIAEVLRGLLGCRLEVALPWLGLPALLLVRLGGAAGSSRPAPWAPVEEGAGRVRPWVWPLALGALLCAATHSWPLFRYEAGGQWDAWMNWNPRVTVLRHGAPRNLRCARLVGYPPGFPAFVAALSGPAERGSGQDFDFWPPRIAAVVSGICLAATLLTCLAWHGLLGAGVLAASVLVVGPGFVGGLVNQTAEMPIACFFLAAAACLSVAARSPDRWFGAYLWAGAFAGLAAWVKQEGLLFALIGAAWVAAFETPRRTRLVGLVAYLVPMALLLGLRTLVMGEVLGPVQPHPFTLDPRWADPERWSFFVRGMMRRTWKQSGYGLLVMGLLWATAPRRGRWRLLVVPAVMSLGFVVVLVVRQWVHDIPHDAPFQLWSTGSRLAFQLQAVWLLGFALDMDAPPPLEDEAGDG